jgi:hypothetical protein
MPRFIVSTHHEVDANDFNHAALLVYQELSLEATPLRFSVRDDLAVSHTVRLNVAWAEAFIRQNIPELQRDGKS